MHGLLAAVGNVIVLIDVTGALRRIGLQMRWRKCGGEERIHSTLACNPHLSTALRRQQEGLSTQAGKQAPSSDNLIGHTAALEREREKVAIPHTQGRIGCAEEELHFGIRRGGSKLTTHIHAMSSTRMSSTHLRPLETATLTQSLLYIDRRVEERRRMACVLFITSAPPKTEATLRSRSNG